MSKKAYTREEIELLKRNKYVKNCSPKYITFIDELKIEALKLDNKGMYFRDIFRTFGFPDFIVNSEVPRQRLKGWRNSMKTKGLSGLVGTKKGRKKEEKMNISEISKDEYIKYLEAKTVYLEELHKASYGHYP